MEFSLSLLFNVSRISNDTCPIDCDAAIMALFFAAFDSLCDFHVSKNSLSLAFLSDSRSVNWFSVSPALVLVFILLGVVGEVEESSLHKRFKSSLGNFYFGPAPTS